MQEYGIDADLWRSYRIGLVMGVVLITTLLLFFPGPHAAAVVAEAAGNRDNQEARDAPHNHHPSRPKSTSSHNNNNNNHSHIGASHYWSPHGQLNAAVYLVLIGVTLYILNQEYKGIFVDGLTRFFPKEAALLGVKR